MPQKQLETVRIVTVIPITEGERYCMVLSYDLSTVSEQDYGAFDIWLARFCTQLKERLEEWFAGDDSFFVIGLPQNVTVKFERVEAEEAEDVHSD